MRHYLPILLLVLTTLTGWAQQVPALDQLQADPKKAYGTDYPYLFEEQTVTRSPRGYKPFYISHYARHGSRYYWNETLYYKLDTLMTKANEQHQLTPEGQRFYDNFLAAKEELMTGISELTQLGWEQHQAIAREMYNRFPEVFQKGGNVLAIASLSGRCVLSMSAFCQELVQCNPKLEIREQSSRFTLDGVAPDDSQNPKRRPFTKVRPRYEKHRDQFKSDNSLEDKIIQRVFTSTEGLPGKHRIASDLTSLYTSLPNIYHEGMMGNILSDQELVDRWEADNLGSYSWVFSDQKKSIPVLRDILRKADAVLDGSSDHVADLRFGHDSYIGPLTVLMGLGGADLDPEDPYKVKEAYQNWQTCKASNIQLIFYRSRKAGDPILVKALLNGAEVSLPVATDNYPYYRWEDVRACFQARCEQDN
ncbi:MAG: hypothetical protein K6E35_03055 [Bacteroidales bacterium]|nr:hypothetical protein [Bacteroidales bacterium]